MHQNLPGLQLSPPLSLLLSLPSAHLPTLASPLVVPLTGQDHSVRKGQGRGQDTEE